MAEEPNWEGMQERHYRILDDNVLKLLNANHIRYARLGESSDWYAVAHTFLFTFLLMNAPLKVRDVIEVNGKQVCTFELDGTELKLFTTR